MASMDKRSNGHYRARWREYPGGPQKTRQFKRKVDADHFLDRIRGDLAHGRYVDPDGGRILFEPYAEKWRKMQQHRSGTIDQVARYLRLHAYPSLGKRQLNAVRRSEIQAWVKRESEVLAPRSVEIVYRWVSRGPGPHPCRRSSQPSSCRVLGPPGTGVPKVAEGCSSDHRRDPDHRQDRDRRASLAPPPLSALPGAPSCAGRAIQPGHGQSPLGGFAWDLARGVATWPHVRRGSTAGHRPPRRAG
jgi:hypothetical protein